MRKRTGSRLRRSVLALTVAIASAVTACGLDLAGSVHPADGGPDRPDALVDSPADEKSEADASAEAAEDAATGDADSTAPSDASGILPDGGCLPGRTFCESSASCILGDLTCASCPGTSYCAASDRCVLDCVGSCGPSKSTVGCVWCTAATASVVRSICEPVAAASCLDNTTAKPPGLDYCPCADPSPAMCPGSALVCAGTGAGAHGCRPCGGMGTDNKACKASGSCGASTFTCL
jgi:hypothetical protein